MQTVNFQCGHCGKLMAVGTDHLGQQVRCPHCGQVVVAPSTPAAESPFAAAFEDPTPDQAPPPQDPVPPQPLGQVSVGSDPVHPDPVLSDFVRHDQEDIFSPPVDVSDDVFGHSEPPRLELPPPEPVDVPAPERGPAHPEAPVEEVQGSEGPNQGEQVAIPRETPVFLQSPIPAVLNKPAAQDLLQTAFPGGQEPTSPVSDQAQPGALVGVGAEGPTAERTGRRGAGRKGDFKVLSLLLLVIIPLILYSVIATAAAAMLYLRVQTAPPNPFEMFPDVNGDVPGVRPAKTKLTVKVTVDEATAPLPEHLHVNLKQALQLGDLEVTPLRVERRKVALLSEGAEDKPEPSPTDALVLHLKLKNVSSRWAFTPLDNYFDRRWKPRSGGPPPLTQLEAGKERFYGGPAVWLPRNRLAKDGGRRDWVKGRRNVDLEGLQPGQETETYVCTDAFDPAVARYLFGVDEGGQQVNAPYQGKLLWRVHLRRGAVTYQGRDFPATAVIGVPFTDRDYRPQG